MIKEAIILAGGLGTRLRPVVSGLPKCMAPVAGKPFLYYVIRHLQQQKIEKFIFAVGYKYEPIEEYLKNEFSTLDRQLSVEDEPMGTGGAVKLACTMASEKNTLVLNGDTLFTIDVHRLSFFHHRTEADCTLSLKPMKHTDRYGIVDISPEHAILSFREKQYFENGLINGGVYALNTSRFLREELYGKFSFEKDYLEVLAAQRKMFGLPQDEYFIDIGIPEDYARAQIELKNNN